MNRTSLTSLVALFAISLALYPSLALGAPVPEFGVKAGLSLATMRGGLEGSDKLLSVGGGAFVNFPLGHGLGLQPELLYVVKGANYGKFQGTDFSGNPTGEFSVLIPIDYLEIPVLLRLQQSTTGFAQPILLIGPAFDFKLRSRLKTTGSKSGSGGFDGIKSTDVGLATGAGLAFGHGRRKITLEGRYTVGLTNVVADENIADSSKNGSLIVMAGVSF